MRFQSELQKAHGAGTKHISRLLQPLMTQLVKLELRPVKANIKCSKLLL